MHIDDEVLRQQFIDDSPELANSFYLIANELAKTHRWRMDEVEIQEVVGFVWIQRTSYDPERGSAFSWVTTVMQNRLVKVRIQQSAIQFLGEIPGDATPKPAKPKVTKARKPRPKTQTQITLTAYGRTLTISQWALKTGLKRGTIWQRRLRGKTPEECVSPV